MLPRMQIITWWDTQSAEENNFFNAILTENMKYILISNLSLFKMVASDVLKGVSVAHQCLGVCAPFLTALFWVLQHASWLLSFVSTKPLNLSSFFPRE